MLKSVCGQGELEQCRTQIVSRFLVSNGTLLQSCPLKLMQFLTLNLKPLEILQHLQLVASGVYLSVVAGLSASLSSVFGKLATDSTIVPLWLSALLPWLSESLSTASYDYLVLGIRGFCFVMIFLTNIIMINLFVKSMNRSTTSEAVVVNTACNFFFTVRLKPSGGKSLFTDFWKPLSDALPSSPSLL